MHGTPYPPLPPPPPAAPPPCDPTNGQIGTVSGLDFSGTVGGDPPAVEMGSSNLGYEGPDFNASEGVTFYNVGETGGGGQIDMVISAYAGYTAWNPAGTKGV